MSVTVKTEGFRELEKKLAALGDPKHAKNAGRQALRRAAVPIRDKAKALVHVDEGMIRKSIKIAAAKKPRKGRGGYEDAQYQVGVVIGIDANVEPAVTRPRKQGKGSYRDPEVAGESVILEFGGVHSPAYPYFRPAWDANKGQSIGRIGQELGPAIERVAKRIAAKAS